jgi:hypothetical protein
VTDFAGLQFIAHPNCQQHLTSIYYGAEMGFLQSLVLWKKAMMWILCVPLIPFFCVVYLFAPDTKVSQLTSEVTTVSNLPG